MSRGQAARVLLFGDNFGMPKLIGSVPRALVCGMVAAAIRPQYHEQLSALATEQGLELIIQPKIGQPEYPAFSKLIRSLRPDLIIVHSYSMLLRPELLSIPKLGAVNIHLAALPRHRGCHPIQY